MWRFYVRYQDGNVSNCSPTDRLNWLACDAVYHRLQPLSQTVIRLYYQRKDTRPPAETIDSFCAREKVPHATVGIIIRSAQTLAAKERGLIDHSYIQKPIHYKE